MTTIPARFVNDSGVTELDGSLETTTPLSYPRVIGPFSFAYNDAGLNDGLPLYTPTAGDILLDMWIAVKTAWNGTTPLGDIGPYAAPGDGGIFGFSTGFAIDLTKADTAEFPNILWNYNANSSLASVSGASNARYAPALLQLATPLKFVVSQDGKRGGTDPGASHGAADLYFVVATPELP